MNSNGYQPTGPRLDDANSPQGASEFKYDVICKVHWGAVPEVKQLLDELNKGVAEFGGDLIPELTAEGTFHLTVTSNKQLPERAMYVVQTTVAYSFIKDMPDYDIRVVSIKEV